MNLDNYFLNNAHLGKAIKDFFAQELLIELKGKQDQPLVAATIFGKEFKHLAQIDNIYFPGGISDNSFNDIGEQNTLSELNKNSKYNAFFVFGIDLSEPKPTRSLLSEIVRKLNSISEGAPVVVVFRYADKLSWATCQRTEKKRGSGEKAGKVSLLRDVSIGNPHRGHHDILVKLRIQTTGANAVRSYQQLYYYWLSVFSISVLNKVSVR
jgi:hypothetical protein